MKEPVNIRFIEHHGEKYLRLEDVITFLRELGYYDRQFLADAIDRLTNAPIVDPGSLLPQRLHVKP